MVATIWIQAFTGTNFDFSTYSSDLKSVLGISQVQLNYLADDLDFMLTTDPWRSYKRTSLDFYGQLIQTPFTMLSIAAASASACSPPPPPPVLAFKRALFAIYTSSLTFLGGKSSYKILSPDIMVWTMILLSHHQDWQKKGRERK
ncbi:Uncharacterized protein Rs2_49584 [Raphanus sativus]|nr:Uncharacterized protein Rs2_49584 [Raphanus sativus]